MDSRDIKIDVPVTLDPLKDIFILQKELIEEYIKIEKTKKYPLNVNLKDNQTLLKDFTSRIIEELAEGYESLNKVAELSEKNQLWFYFTNEKNPLRFYLTNSSTSKDYNELLGHLQNVSEEFADALHFFIELLIYANIEDEDIKDYLRSSSFSKNYTGECIEGRSTLSQCLIAGSYLLVRDGIVNAKDGKFKMNPVDLLRNKPSEKDLDDRLLQMGRFYHPLLFTEILPRILWDVTYHLNLSRNFLRNKPWKQSQVFVNEQGYQEELLTSFLRFMGIFSFFSLDEKEIFYIYFKKNKINQFRIRSKY